MKTHWTTNTSKLYGESFPFAVGDGETSNARNGENSSDQIPTNRSHWWKHGSRDPHRRHEHQVQSFQGFASNSQWSSTSFTNLKQTKNQIKINCSCSWGLVNLAWERRLGFLFLLVDLKWKGVKRRRFGF
jgi:hypothetical protein